MGSERVRLGGLIIGDLFEKVGDRTPLTSMDVCLLPLSGSVLRTGKVRSREGTLRSCEDWKLR